MIKLKNIILEFLNESRSEGETFSLMGFGMFHINDAKSIINKKNIQPKEINLINYAENTLGLNRKEPDKHPMSFLCRIDFNYLNQISDERLKEPIIIANAKIQHSKDKRVWAIVIDGNHRLAKNYLNGKDTILAYILDEKDTKKILY